jgi:hypothetical protein
MDKSNLKQTIKEWVRLDDESAVLKKQLRQLNHQKKEMSAKLIEIMKDQKIDQFDLNNDGKLIRQTKTIKQPINKKTLLLNLSKYYNDDANAVKVTEFLLNTRTEKVSETLCKK